VRHFLCCLLIALSGPAAADSLSEANKLYAAKAYGEAFPVYKMLADGGNAEAKLRLGQMNWYGKGLPVDRARADQLFAEAAASGNKEAKEALTLTGRREARSADIAKWTNYDGADLTAGKYACATPTIADVARTNEEIKGTMEAYGTWSACYNGFAADLEGPLAPARRIPADLQPLMSEAEQQQAMERVYATTQATVEKVGGQAQTVMARYDSWEKATMTYAHEHNNGVAAKEKELALLMENERRRWELSAGKMGGSPRSSGK
jgi:TPR repeat protein